MKNRHVIGIVVLITSICFFSCRKKIAEVPINYGREFYPIQIGKSITYQADSTIYDDFNGAVYHTTSYIKDVIDTPSLDLLNRKIYHVFRYYKAKPTDEFQFLSNYTIQEIDNRVELLQDNLRYIKLVFPITYLGTWGGTKYIVTNSSSDAYSWIGQKEYSYKEVGRPYQNDSINIPNTIMVFHTNELLGDTTETMLTFGVYTYSTEKYGKDIGLVNKELIFIKKDPAISSGRRKGFRSTLKCIAHN
jgi:hypothetical protein